MKREVPVCSAANQQLTFGSYNILYDANGNVTNIVSGTTTNKLLWSSRNQLTNMLGAVTASFVYDGLGCRRQRVVSSVTENYLYDGLDIILQKTAAGAVGARYLRGLGIDEPWQRTDLATVNTNRVYLADALGSIVALADTNKVIQTEYDYEPFGTTTTTGTGNKNSYKFTAREDDGTGLYYYRARFYHPALGRFVSEDPLRYQGGDVNLYGYVRNQVLTSVDSLGLQFYEPPLDSTASAFHPIEVMLDALRIYTDVRRSASNDEFAHCLASCLLAKRYGRALSDLFGSVKEARDLSVRGIGVAMGKNLEGLPGNSGVGASFDRTFQGGSVEDSARDFAANFAGQEAAAAGLDCETECKKKYDCP
jgi:RHS repeat-associated protein